MPAGSFPRLKMALLDPQLRRAHTDPEQTGCLAGRADAGGVGLRSHGPSKIFAILSFLLFMCFIVVFNVCVGAETSHTYRKPALNTSNKTQINLFITELNNFFLTPNATLFVGG
jgi:hypothetical protein